MSVGGGDGHTGCIYSAEAHTPPGHRGYVVLNEELYRETLVGGAVEPAEGVTLYVFLCLHQRQANPRLQPIHELAVDTQTESCGVGDGLLVGIVVYAQVVDGIWYKVCYVLVVQVCCYLERLVPQAQ